MNYKRGKPPDKRRHHMEMNKYTELIHQKEALFVSFALLLYRKYKFCTNNLVFTIYIEALRPNLKHCYLISNGDLLFIEMIIKMHDEFINVILIS